MNRATLEALAVEAHRRANLPLWFPRGIDLAQALAVVVLFDAGVAAVGGVLPWVEQRAMYVQPGPDDAVSLRIFRGLAVLLLAEQPGAHHRVDVEHLALALAVPADRIEHVEHFVQNIPAAAVAERLRAVGASEARGVGEAVQ